MTDHESFLAAICAHPEDDLPRLVLADWLEEHGEADRAELIRVQVWLAANPSCGGCTGTEWQHGKPCAECDRRDALRRRERELWEAGHHGRDFLPTGWHDLNLFMEEDAGFARGFVAHVTLSAADWLVHADALYWHPEQTVACEAVGPHHDDKCSAGRVQSPNAQFTRSCQSCDGKGRISRPFVPTTQPIERVTITSLLFGRPVSVRHHYPVMYDLCRKHGLFDARGREPVELWASMGRWAFWERVLGAEWPHVKFTPGPGVRNPYAGFEAGVA